MVVPLVGLGGACARPGRGVLAGASLIIRPTEDGMWRRVLYLVCTVEAGVLAAILAALVIEPDLTGSTLTPGMRQLCAVVALALMIGCAFAVDYWLDDAVMSVRERVRARRETASQRSLPGASDLAENHQFEQSPRTGRDRRAA